MATGKKQISFDLDTKALKTYYPSGSWKNAYEVIRHHMATRKIKKDCTAAEFQACYSVN